LGRTVTRTKRDQAAKARHGDDAIATVRKNEFIGLDDWRANGDSEESRYRPRRGADSGEPGRHGQPAAMPAVHRDWRSPPGPAAGSLPVGPVEVERVLLQGLHRPDDLGRPGPGKQVGTGMRRWR
jgi:hypothetical protein